MTIFAISMIGLFLSLGFFCVVANQYETAHVDSGVAVFLMVVLGIIVLISLGSTIAHLPR